MTSAWSERLIVAPLIILIVLLGVFPKPVLDRITPSVDQLVVHVDQVTHTPVPAGLTRSAARRPPAASRGRQAGPRRLDDGRPAPSPVAGRRRVTGAPRCWRPAAPTIHIPHVDYLSILPMLIMMGGALALMVVSSLFRKILGVGTGTLVAVVVSLAALVAALFQWDHVAPTAPRSPSPGPSPSTASTCSSRSPCPSPCCSPPWSATATSGARGSRDPSSTCWP